MDKELSVVAEPADTFGAVVCGVDRSVDSRAAHQQAVLLAEPGGELEVVPAPRLTRHGDRALHEACAGHDLVALGAGAGAAGVVEHAPIPVLIGRWSPPGTELTDRILVALDDSPASRRALTLAARLAAAHGGSVTVLVAPQRDPALQRAIAASRRIVLETTGALPNVVGEQLPRDRAIPATAAAIDASLVVLATGEGPNARRAAAQIAGSIEASVLAVPPPGETAGRPVPCDATDAVDQVDPDGERRPDASTSPRRGADSRSHRPVSSPAERAAPEARERRGDGARQRLGGDAVVPRAQTATAIP